MTGTDTAYGTSPLLAVENLSTMFQVSGRGLFASARPLYAVNDVSFTIAAGETLGVVGESGCGKSTLGRSILRLIEPTSGQVRFEGQDLATLDTAAMRALRAKMQIIFQDPIASLNPRMTVGNTIGEPLEVFRPDLSRANQRDKVQQTMEIVGLARDMVNRYPHEFSGGQAQRIGIARAIVAEPKLLICDEPVSALDVSIQAQIIKLLMTLRDQLGLSLMFISHDLSVVRLISDRIVVLYLGRVVEIGPAATVFAAPRHPYSQALLSAVPIPDPKLARARERVRLVGELPSPLNPPSGCAFRSRCLVAEAACANTVPPLTPRAAQQHAACLLDPAPIGLTA
jgi:oligopeptide transport system ATP-binding protein